MQFNNPYLWPETKASPAAAGSIGLIDEHTWPTVGMQRQALVGH